MCLIGEISVGDVSDWESVRRGCVWSGKCLSGKCPSGKSQSEKRSSGMCPGITITACSDTKNGQCNFIYPHLVMSESYI